MHFFYRGLDLDLRCPTCDYGVLAMLTPEHCYLCLGCRAKHEINAVIDPAERKAAEELERDLFGDG